MHVSLANVDFILAVQQQMYSCCPNEKGLTVRGLILAFMLAKALHTEGPIVSTVGVISDQRSGELQ